MLLILSNSEDVTADYLQESLLAHEIPHLRFDTDNLLSKVSFSYSSSIPRLHINGKIYSPEDISNIWYRRPERLVPTSSLAEESETNHTLDEWSEALEGFLCQVPPSKWMNHPSSNAMASHKLEQLSRASRKGFLIPKTLVTQDPEKLREFYSECQQRIIVKPLSQGLIEDIKKTQHL